MAKDKEVQALDDIIEQLNKLTKHNTVDNNTVKYEDKGKFNPIPLPDYIPPVKKDELPKK